VGFERIFGGDHRFMQLKSVWFECTGKAGREEMSFPFASITWSRFEGSSADRCRTLSHLSAALTSERGWDWFGSPVKEATMRWRLGGVKDGAGDERRENAKGRRGITQSTQRAQRADGEWSRNFFALNVSFLLVVAGCVLVANIFRGKLLCFSV
jgi:hypothetical protein